MGDTANITVNGLGSGAAASSVAKKLQKFKFDVNALRPFAQTVEELEAGKGYITIGNKAIPLVGNNATLLIDEWKAFDDAVIRAFREELSFVPEIMTRGLTYPLNNPLGTIVLIHQNMSDAIQAQMTMDANVQNQGDTPEFGQGALPIPIISSGFNIDIRFLETSRRGQFPLDTTLGEMSARANASFLENLALFGSGTITETQKVTLDFFDNAVTAALRFSHAGYKIDGIFSKDEAVEYTLANDWLSASTTGQQMVLDVLAMKRNLIEQGYSSNHVLFLPSYLQTRLAQDYKAAESSSTSTILARLQEIPDTEYRFIDTIGRFQPTSGQYINMAMVSMRSDVIRMVDGFDNRLVEWETHGGMNTNYRNMTIMVPELRTRQAGDCGIVKAHIQRS